MAAEKWPPEIEKKTATLDYILFLSEMVINRDQLVQLGPRFSNFAWSWSDSDRPSQATCHYDG